MGQKDLTQKNLESYPDVFADIINALLYEGRQVILPERLQSAPTESLYYSKRGALRNQLQDISKYELHGNKIKLQYTMENEINPDNKLILRKAGYEGAIYREQFDGKTRELYPVISIVLYWGKGKKRIAHSMKSFFEKKALPDEIMRYVGNDKLHIFGMRYLPKKVRERFQSDMRIVVDYLAEEKDYQPTGQAIVHLKEFLLFMREIAEDSRYEQLWTELEQERQDGKGEITMCELLDRYENRGIEKGIEKGIKALVVTCKSLQCTKKDVMQRLRSLYDFKSDEEAMKKVNLYW